MKRSKSKSCLIAITFVLLGASSVYAGSVFTFDINSIEGNTDLPGSQFQLEIFEATGGRVEFKISNLDQEGAIASSIYRLYVDDDASVLASLFSADSGFGIDPANPINLPGGVNIGFSADFGVDANAGRFYQENAIAVGEMASFVFDLNSGIFFADVLEALGDGDSRVGIHVGGIGGDDGDSDSFVTVPSSVPEPGTLSLLAAGLLVGAAFRKRFQ